VIGEEAVGELADSVGIKKCRTNHAQFGGSKDAGVDDRFLDHPERQAAGVDQAVAQGDGQHHAQAVLAVLPVDLAAVGDLGLIGAGCEECQPSTRHRTPPRWAGAGCVGLVAVSLFYFTYNWKNYSISGVHRFPPRRHSRESGNPVPFADHTGFPLSRE
jgi:hypothetical protein